MNVDLVLEGVVDTCDDDGNPLVYGGERTQLITSNLKEAIVFPGEIV